MVDHPAVKDGVRVAAVAEGVYLDHAGRGFVLRGRGLHPLVVRMLAAINGRQAPAIIEAALPEGARPLFCTILDRLGAAAMLTSGTATAIADQDPHADTLRYLREMTPDWRQWFATWRKRPITIVAPPPVAALLAQRLAECGADMVVQGEAETSETLLIAVIDGTGKPPRRTAATPYLACLVARPHADGAILVGRSDGDIDAAWQTIAAGSGDHLAPITREALCAILAFEALWSCAPVTAGREERRAFGDVRIVRADGRVVRHPAAIAAASGRLDGDAPTPVVTPVGTDAAWFDPVVGPFERTDAALSPYPLVHCGILIRAGAAAGATVRGWGLDAEAAEAAAIEQAIALFESARAGWSPAPGRSPVIVAPDEDTLYARAGALARAALPQIRARYPRVPTIAEQVEGRDARTLLRLLRLYTGRWPTLWSSDTKGLALVWAQLDHCHAVGASADIGSAWVNALGDLLSDVQLNALTTRQSTWPIAALRDAPPPDTRVAPGPAPADDRFRLIRLTGEHLHGRAVGYAEFAR